MKEEINFNKIMKERFKTIQNLSDKEFIKYINDRQKKEKKRFKEQAELEKLVKEMIDYESKRMKKLNLKE